jgi:beta-barrel assembly-enhancing protease
MKKLAGQFLLLLVPFVVLFGILYRIDFYNRFELRKQIDSHQKNLSAKFWDWQDQSEISDSRVREPILKMAGMLLRNQHTEVSIHVVRDDAVNAYALPGNHIVINSGLILKARNSEELSAVIAHELGHVIGHHTSKNLIKDVIIYAVQRATGEEVTNIIFKEVLGKGSSLAYQRRLEEEADKIGTQLLNRQFIDPLFLGLFLKENAVTNGLDWISTHPDPEYRIKLIKTYRGAGPYEKGRILTEVEWRQFKDLVEQRYGN